MMLSSVGTHLQIVKASLHPILNAQWWDLGCTRSQKKAQKPQKEFESAATLYDRVKAVFTALPAAHFATVSSLAQGVARWSWLMCQELWRCASNCFTKPPDSLICSPMTR
jgi:hypothetical protein